MRSLQTRGWKKKIIYSKFSVALLLIVVFFMITVVWNMYGKFQATQARATLAEERLNELKEQKIDLEAKVDRLQTKRGKEAELRQKFLIAKEGEKVLVIVDDEAKKEEIKKEKEKSWWESILSFF